MWPLPVSRWAYRQMTTEPDFFSALEAKVKEQLKAQRVGYLLGAGSSNLDNTGYPLSFELWNLIKDKINDIQKRAEIQAKLDAGATGIEHALDLLDDGGASPHSSPEGPEKAALFGIKRLTRTFHKPNKGGPYDNRV